MTYKCTNCPWMGEELNDKYCPNCGDNVDEIVDMKQPKPVVKEKVNLDLNGDGKVDKKDRSIASKVMNAGRRKRK